jgi:hypothetical protein
VLSAGGDSDTPEPPGDIPPDGTPKK